MIKDQHRLLIIQITEKFFNETPIDITHIPDKGTTNEVFKIELSEKKIVVRISPENNTDQFTKEAWGMEQARKLHIPSPKVFEVGIHNNTVYMLLEYIDGIHGIDSSLDTTRLWTVLGQYAKIIHTIPIEGFGDHISSPGKFDSKRKNFSEYLEYNITNLNTDDKLIQMGILTPSKSEKIKALFESLRNKQFDFGLNHGDLSLKNIITNKNGVFLLDWGSSEVHIIPHFDFMEVLQVSFYFDFKHKDFIAFLKGYRLSEAQFFTIKPVMEILAILRAIDKLRWAIETNPGKVEYFKGIVVKVLDDLNI